MTHSLPDPNFFSDASSADMAHASYDESLSHLVVRNEAFFEATIDRLLFKNLLEIITPALEASGYAANLENILYALEQTTIGIRSFESKKTDEPTKIKKFIPAVFFKLPKKTEQGFLLSEFYREINRYEVELRELKTARNAPADEQNLNDTKELAHLRAQNQHLNQKLLDLTEHLHHLSSELDGIKKTSEQSTAVLPADMLVGDVLKVDFERETVTLQLNSAQRQIPWAAFEIGLPRVGAKVLWFDDKISNSGMKVSLLENPAFFFELELATMLHFAQDQVKIRTQNRTEFVFALTKINFGHHAQNLPKGSILLVKKFQQSLVSATVLASSDHDKFISPLKEAFLKFDIRDSVKD